MGAVVPTRSCAHSSGHGQRGAPAGASLGTWCPFPPHLPSAPHQRLGLQEPAWHQAGRMEDSRDGQRGGTLQPLRSHSHPRQPRRPQPQPRGFPCSPSGRLFACGSALPFSTDRRLGL